MGISLTKKKKETDKPCSSVADESMGKEKDSSSKSEMTSPPPDSVTESSTWNDGTDDGENEKRLKEKQMEPKDKTSRPADDDQRKDQHLSSKDTDQDLQSIVDRCWQEIDRQCLEHVAKNYSSSVTSSNSGWRVVRLFVSSTFQDFQNEREVLVKKVFPELREWCESRHLHLIECDLRWGVPKDSTTHTVLTTCMEEIDRCHGDANGEGFFLNMLGERYGWVPTVDDIPNDVAEEYAWVPLTSVTHMEVLLGAYRSHNPNAAFFLRDPSGFAEMIPAENKRQFEEPTELGRLLLKDLKIKLREQFPEQTFDYSCEFEAAQDSKVKLKPLDEFAKQVLEFFKKAIDKKFPDSEGNVVSPEKLEQNQHDIYMEQKGRLVFGRDKEINQMMNFAQGIHKDEGLQADNESHYMLVIADPGEGKSSLMARLVMQAKKAGLTVFYHFVGCTAESNRPSCILKRLVGTLETLYPDLCTSSSGNENSSLENAKDEDEQNVKKLVRYVKDLGETANRLLVVVDAINQSSQEKDRYRWLPPALSGNLQCILSTTREDRTLEELRQHCMNASELTLSTLDDIAKQEIVTNYFARYNKTLDPEQLTLLTHSEGAENALWLSLSCEELRVFGVFEKLTERIREMPVSLEGLIETILERLIREDDTGMVEKMLHFLQCVSGGLMEMELQSLLGDIDAGAPAPALHWAMVRRTLKPFLRNSAANGEAERLQFFHLAINKAVQKQLNDDFNLKKLRHCQLADYFQYHCTDSSAVVSQLPYQLAQAKEGQRLMDFFRKDKRSTGVNVVERSRLLKEFRCTNMTKPDFPGCTKFGFCTFCMNARSTMNTNSPWPNKDCCAICGHKVPFAGKKCAKAYWCPFHKPAFPTFGSKFSCFICQKSINQPKDDPPLAYLCNFCDPGFMERCCKLVP